MGSARPLRIADCRLSRRGGSIEKVMRRTAVLSIGSTIGNRQSTIDNPLGHRRLRGGGSKRMSLHFRLEVDLPMRPVAEGFTLRMATTAKPNRSSPTQVECVTPRVVYCEFPFNPQRAVLVYSDLRQVFLHNFRFEYRLQLARATRDFPLIRQAGHCGAIRQ